MAGIIIDSPIFTPVTIGPVTLRNRVIRSAAFENMAYHNSPSKDLYDYHVAVARGGVGMTTLAYVKCNRCVENLPAPLRREVDKLEKRWSHS